MIITKIRLEEEHPMTDATNTWALPVCDLNLDSSAGQNGYILKNAVGIGPPDFVAVVEGFDINGVPVMDSVPGKREIALRVGFRPGPGQSVQQLRSDLHRYISRSVLLSFMNDTLVVAQVSGFIQKFEALHFSNQPEIQVTILCRTGDFQAPYSATIPLAGLDTNTPVITYEEGDAPTGMELVFDVSASGHTSFTISDYGKLWYASAVPVENEFKVTYNFNIGDRVTIRTDRGSKQVVLRRSSVDYDLAGYLNGGTVWPRLFPGVNAFTWDIRESWVNWVSASYTPKFWGV